MSITAYEAAARLARRHAAKGAAELTSAESVLVAEAISEGLIETFRLLPPAYREQPVVFTATPRFGVACSVTAGSATLGSAAFLASEVGCTVIFADGGDVTWNQIEATDRLRVPWGGTTGTANATIYADAAASGVSGRVERLVNDPVLLETDGTRRRLYLMPEEEGSEWMNRAPRVGSPDRYFLEPAGRVSASAADSPTALLRLWLIPATPVRVLARCALWPARLRATGLSATAILPVPIGVIEDLIDLCGPRLAVMPGWQQVQYKAAVNVAQRAENRLRFMPAVLHAPSNRVQTPYGY